MGHKFYGKGTEYCANCGELASEHRMSDGACPVKGENGIEPEKFINTVFEREPKQ